MRASPRGLIAILLALAVLAGVPVQAQLPGERYALLVGVHKYARSSELRELQYTERDMVELAEVLRAGGYRPENIVLMTQTAGVEDSRFLPTSDHIRKELKALLRDRIEADSVLVAFAGHGIQFRGSAATYFCPADARTDDRSTLLPLDEVYQTLAGCQARFKLLLSDACRNDPIAAVSRRATVALDSVTRPQLQRPPGGVAALFSCSEGELAYEADALKHGVFFHFVIEGLRGGADFDKDGLIELEELTFFAKRRVLDYVRAEYDGLRQMPVLKGEIGGLPILISLNRAAVPERPAPRPAAPMAAETKLATRTPSTTTPRPAEPVEKKTLTNTIGMKLVLIPSGEFLMGSSEGDKEANPVESPQHRVQVTRPFHLGAMEVTQGQYRAVKGQNPSSFTDSDDLPVENVSWNDAVAFCNTLSAREGLEPYYKFAAGAHSGGDGYRLPTEAEWEYACRAGSATRYSFGDDASDLDEYAWFGRNSEEKTHPVGQKRPNAWGLYDMHGNVSEWCRDWFDWGYYGQSPRADPSGPRLSPPSPQRVSRGGGWISDPGDCRAAYRDRDPPDSDNGFLGFRVARSLARTMNPGQVR